MSSWRNLNSWQWLPVWAIVAVLGMTIWTVRQVQSISIKQNVRRWIDIFFDNILRVPPNRFLERISVAGLLALIAGKIALSIIAPETIHPRVLASITGSAGVAAAWQLWAVQHGNLEQRTKATFTAFVAWTLSIINLLIVYVPVVHSHSGRLGVEYALLALIFDGLCWIQMLVLIREQLATTTIPDEVKFALFCVDEYEKVFPLQNRTKLDIVGFVDASYNKWKQVR